MRSKGRYYDSSSGNYYDRMGDMPSFKERDERIRRFHPGPSMGNHQSIHTN